MPNRHKLLFIIGLVLLAVGLSVGIGSYYKDGRYQTLNFTSHDWSLRLTSPAFEPGGDIPERYTCQNRNISPPLIISGTPNTAKSLALVMYDPDDLGGELAHWVAWNLPPRTESIGEGSLPPSAISGRNSEGKTGYKSPCPSEGEVRYYRFEIYALAEDLSLSADASKQELAQAIQGKVLSQATLIGRFDRR